ncbi:MAG: hypothetical protein JRE23_12245 [Deltaproteobacteria bacterium]|nr:hypothetical protein [Deltaproteobacteria bacterium]
MKYRDNHCSFARLNTNGKCVAPCIHNVDPDVEYDCIGRAGKTLDTKDLAEVKLTSNLKLDM